MRLRFSTFAVAGVAGLFACANSASAQTMIGTRGGSGSVYSAPSILYTAPSINTFSPSFTSPSLQFPTAPSFAAPSLQFPTAPSLFSTPSQFPTTQPLFSANYRSPISNLGTTAGFTNPNTSSGYTPYRAGYYYPNAYNGNSLPLPSVGIGMNGGFGNYRSPYQGVPIQNTGTTNVQPHNTGTYGVPLYRPNQGLYYGSSFGRRIR